MRRDEARATFREADEGFELICLALEHDAWLHKSIKVPGNRRAEDWDVETLNVSVDNGLVDVKKSAENWSTLG